MTQARDESFSTLVNLAIGGLIGVAVSVFFVLSNYLDARTEALQQSSAEYRRELQERIAPFGRTVVAGSHDAALAMPASASAPSAAPPLVLSGEATYQTTCVACHGAGIAGAPKFADQAAWKPRIAEGLAALKQHALAGFQGAAGVMPAKGGRPDLADQSVADAVDYMVKAAK